MIELHGGPIVDLVITHTWTRETGVVAMASKNANKGKGKPDADGRGRHRATTERTVDRGPAEGFPVQGGRRTPIGRPPEDVVDKLLKGES